MRVILSSLPSKHWAECLPEDTIIERFQIPTPRVAAGFNPSRWKSQKSRLFLSMKGLAVKNLLKISIDLFSEAHAASSNVY